MHGIDLNVGINLPEALFWYVYTPQRQGNSFALLSLKYYFSLKLMVRSLSFSVVIEKDEDGYYVAYVPELPGCHTQAKTLDELLERIKEAVELYLDVDGVFYGN